MDARRKQKVRRFWANKEQLFDGIIDLGLDVLLILIDVLSAPIILPAKLLAHGLKKIVKMALTRSARKAVKGQVKKRLVTRPKTEQRV